MKISFSIIAAGLSGSAGDVTAANWKGRPYLRTRVTPTNPNTANQQAQRNGFKRAMFCFQALAALVKTFLDLIGADTQVSGSNAFMSSNVPDEVDSYAHGIIPANRYAETLQGFAAATGAGASGTIDVTWDAGSYIAGDIPYIWYRKRNGAGPDYETPWTVFDVGAVEMDDEAITITGLTAAGTYAVAMAPYDTSEAAWGGGDFATGVVAKA